MCKNVLQNFTKIEKYISLYNWNMENIAAHISAINRNQGVNMQT